MFCVPSASIISPKRAIGVTEPWTIVSGAAAVVVPIPTLPVGKYRVPLNLEPDVFGKAVLAIPYALFVRV